MAADGEEGGSLDEVTRCFHAGLDPATVVHDDRPARETLARLEERLDEVRSQIFDVVRLHKGAFVATYERSSHLASRGLDLKRSLRALAADTKDCRDHYASRMDELEAFSRALEEARQAAKAAVGFLQKLQGAQDAVDHVEAMLSAGNVCGAAEHMRTHPIDLQPTDVAGVCASDAEASRREIGRLRTLFADQSHRVTAQLAAWFHEAVRVDDSGVLIATTVHHGAVDTALTDVREARRFSLGEFLGADSHPPPLSQTPTHTVWCATVQIIRGLDLCGALGSVVDTLADRVCPMVEDLVTGTCRFRREAESELGHGGARHLRLEQREVEETAPDDPDGASLPSSLDDMEAAVDSLELLLDALRALRPSTQGGRASIARQSTPCA